MKLLLRGDRLGCWVQTRAGHLVWRDMGPASLSDAARDAGWRRVQPPEPPPVFDPPNWWWDPIWIIACLSGLSMFGIMIWSVLVY